MFDSDLILASMMNLERRKGKDKPVIRKSLVDLDGPIFKTLDRVRESWALRDDYRMPGPIQLTGGSAEEARTFSLLLEHEARTGRI